MADAMAFPPAGWTDAPSQGNRAARYGNACGRDARAPGWAPLRSVFVDNSFFVRFRKILCIDVNKKSVQA